MLYLEHLLFFHWINRYEIYLQYLYMIIRMQNVHSNHSLYYFFIEEFLDAAAITEPTMYFILKAILCQRDWRNNKWN